MFKSARYLNIAAVISERNVFLVMTATRRPARSQTDDNIAIVQDFPAPADAARSIPGTCSWKGWK